MAPAARGPFRQIRPGLRLWTLRLPRPKLLNTAPSPYPHTPHPNCWTYASHLRPPSSFGRFGRFGRTIGPRSPAPSFGTSHALPPPTPSPHPIPPTYFAPHASLGLHTLHRPGASRRHGPRVMAWPGPVGPCCTRARDTGARLSLFARAQADPSAMLIAAAKAASDCRQDKNLTQGSCRRGLMDWSACYR